jgi:predicted chitinase
MFLIVIGGHEKKLHEQVHEYLYQQERLPGQVTVSELVAMGASQGNAERYARPLSEAMAAEDMISVEQRAAFLGQVWAETDALSVMEENLSYRAERIHQVWPGRFPTIESATPYARNPEALANKTYGGRNGNYLPGDGWAYRGRSFIQFTGRYNYRLAGFEDRPDALLQDDYLGALASAQWFSAKGLVSQTKTQLTESQYLQISKAVNNPSGTPHGATKRWNAYSNALLLIQPR